jgi:hypothetical protein
LLPARCRRSVDKSQGRDASDAAPDRFDVTRGYDALFSRRPDNVFLIKASYWLGR